MKHLVDPVTEDSVPGMILSDKRENMSTFRRTFNLTKTSYGPGFYLTIVLKISQDINSHENSETTGNFAQDFNDSSTSDFKIICHNHVFHVHQWILKQKSEYFSALLRNDFLENKNKELKIEDFEPRIVEMLLRYLYNGTICLSELLGKVITVSIGKI